ncbi:hypothetical protein TNCV_4281541 [Trichonephila clavipes]|nr:hypothetical protein TNCV_4281541 [Trichonephila clavipes]
MDTLGEEASVLVVEPIFNSSLDLIIGEKSPSLQKFLKRIEDVVFSRHMRTNIIMQDDNPTGQHASSDVFDIFFQFLQWITVKGSIDSLIVWRHP